MAIVAGDADVSKFLPGWWSDERSAEDQMLRSLKALSQKFGGE